MSAADSPASPAELPLELPPPLVDDVPVTELLEEVFVELEDDSLVAELLLEPWVCLLLELLPVVPEVLLLEQ